MGYSKDYYLVTNDLNALLQAVASEGVSGGVSDELEVVADSPEDMGVVVKAGEARFGTSVVTKSTETDVPLDAAGTKPRKDIIVINSSGTISVVKGTEADADPVGQSGPNTKTPEPPSIPASSIILAEVWVGASATEIYNTDITDRRAILGPVIHTPAGVTADDLIYFDGDVWVRLARGSEGDVLSLLASGFSWKKVARLAYEWGGIYLDGVFDCISGWDPDTSGSGSITISSYSVLLDTGATASSTAKIRKRPLFYARATPSWSKVRRVCFGVAAWPTADKTVWLVTGQPGVNRHFGFKLSGADIYATVADGTTENTSSIGTVSSDRQHLQLEAIFDPGVDCKFYMSGALQATLDTNLPSGSTDAEYLFYGWVENSVAASRKIEISEIKVLQEP